MHKNIRILLVIEDLNLDKILTYLLKAWNYEVILCTDGNEALTIAAKKHPDLIMIDAHLSKIDGLKLCKILKYDFATAYIPIIILIKKKQLRRSLLDIEQGVDDFLIKPPDPIDLEIRIALSLKSADHQFHANALTKLPGNRSIEKIMKSRLEEQKRFSFAYLDINNFKSFNDQYGYMAGDRVILQVAKIITSTVKKFGNSEDFVGHIGGDDFVYVTTPEKEEEIATECLREFDRLIPLHYTVEDRNNGFIKTRDRSGHAADIPLIGISISIVNNSTTKITSIFQLIEIAFEIKKFLKKYHTSHYLVNRRVADDGLHQRQSIKEKYAHEFRHRHSQAKKYKPLGQIMLEMHLLTEEQLNETLNYHWNTGQHLGEAAVSMGFIDEQHLKRVLEHQPTFH